MKNHSCKSITSRDIPKSYLNLAKRNGSPYKFIPSKEHLLEPFKFSTASNKNSYTGRTVMVGC
jgi:hypothetical protein